MNIRESYTADIVRDTARDKSLSLKQKLTLHLEERKKEPAASPRNLNKYLPFVFIAEVTIVWYYGTCQAIPLLYADFGQEVTLIIQSVCTFMAFQVVLNWWCVFSVSSAYDPQRHGTYFEFLDRQAKTTSQNTTPFDSQNTVNGAEGTTIGSTSGSPARVPYWSWRYCTLCDQPRPPRCHHCKLCNTCSLKRDHHCYFSRNCIGYRNLRHYTVMMFWSWVSSVVSFVHALPFIFMEVLPSAGHVDMLPLVAFFRWIFGYAHFRVGIVILGTWMLALFVIFTTFMLFEIVRCIIRGKTSFEIDNKIKISDTRSVSGKLNAAFGDFWLLNFLLPMHWRFHPEEDPVFWPTINQ
ncbi:palmitoyltransferase ZDHHC15B-like [Ylistrum balloti]|uniref:palmitoyltransferase ZDHHC15B-like n=1 Tax=Ylistrum balloti TaxID=509963 RepID=UPI0029059E3B|nr:palmitoyltransferase ZDHHC15B-like [Ylistrum balloti]